MISLRDLTLGQRILLAAGIAVVVAALLVLFAAADLNLSPLTTLSTSQTNGHGTVVVTQYNPIAISGLALIVLTALGVLGLSIVGLARALPDVAGRFIGGSGAGAAVAQAGRRLEQELARVLGLIRAHITTNESYAKSLSSAQSRLAGLSEAEQVRVIVSLLVAENERMRRDSEALKSRLEESHSQIQTLRSSLTHAQEVVLKDPLTGTGNRRQFDVSMEKAIRESEQKALPLSLIMCDIDHFKRVNDTYGHDAGDLVLKEFSERFRRYTRGVDLACRLGGEEFLIIMPDTDKALARQVGERVRECVAVHPFPVGPGVETWVTASVGLATWEGEGDTSEALFKRADNALYAAKRQGRNQVVADAA